MKFFILFLLVSVNVSAAATLKKEPTVTLKKVWQIPAKTQHQKFTIGGLSGCYKQDQSISFVSDDRGNQGEPRILILKWDEQKQELNVKDFKWLILPKDKILDLEGLSYLNADKILLSNEGDLNKKPRQPAEIFWINNKGQRLATMQLPDKFIPNLSGEQTQGTQNNLGFEGLAIDKDTQTWGAFLEGPLVQDRSKLLFIEGSVNALKPEKEWSYEIPRFMGDGLGIGMGVSDFIYDKSQNLIVIERGVDLSLQGMRFNAQLCTAQKDAEKSLLKKECFYDFSQDKTLISQIKEVANFEGLCWINEQKTQFLVVSDNNFSKTQNSLFLLYQID